MNDGAPEYDLHHGEASDILTLSSVLLTGGASRRMGSNKAELQIDGEPLGLRLATKLRASGWEPIVLGREPIPGFAFLPDGEAFGGPLSALRTVKPSTEWVFVLACDIPLFDPVICQILLSLIGECQAAIPSLNDRLQPLCALYRSSAWESLVGLRSFRIMDWVTSLEIMSINEEVLTRAGAHPEWCKGVNTPSELKALAANVRLAMD